MEAVILAGGLGTRLSPVLYGIPKALAPIAGKPFLDYLLDNLAHKGITKAVLAVGYMRESVMMHCSAQCYGAELLFSEEETPLLTGGALKQALRMCSEEDVFVFNGDTFFDVDLLSMAAEYKRKASSLMIAVKEMRNFTRYGSLELKNDKIVCFNEKQPCSAGYINGGVYCLSRTLLESVPKNCFSFENDFLARRCELQDGGIDAFVSYGYFIDIGVPEDYFRAQNELPKVMKA